MNPTVSHLFNSLPSGKVKVSSFYSYAGFLIMCKAVLMYYILDQYLGVDEPLRA